MYIGSRRFARRKTFLHPHVKFHPLLRRDTGHVFFFYFSSVVVVFSEPRQLSTAKIHGRVALLRNTRPPQVLSQKGSSSTGFWSNHKINGAFAVCSSHTDRVITRTPLHMLYDFFHELLTSRPSYFSFRSLFSTVRFSLCQAQSFVAVMNFMVELVALIRRIVYVFGEERFSRQVICVSEFAGTLEGLAWISEVYDDFIICHSASL